MQLRKLFAGVAAAATLLGGLALGAATANAAEVPSAITVGNSQESHTYTAYKFADLKLVQRDGKNEVEVTTASGSRAQLTISGYEKVVAGLAAQAAGVDAVPEPYTGEPAAYVTTFDQATLRKFADAFTAVLGKSLDGQFGISGDVTITTKDSAGSVAGTGEDATLNVGGQGWYLVTDTVTKADGTVVSGGASAIVATPLGDANDQTLPVANADPTQNGIDVTGKFNAKHSENPVPGKTSDKDEVGVVGYGESVTYTIKATIPDTTNYDETHPLPLYVKDVASKGLKVPAKVGDFTGFRAGYDANKDGKLQNSEVLKSGYSIESQTGDAKTGTTTVVKIDNVAGHAGETLLVAYTAYVTEDAATDGVTNTPYVGNDNQNWVGGKHDTLKTVNVKFTKQGADGKALAGAQFAIKYKGEETYLEYGQTDQWSLPSWHSTTNKTDYTVTSAADGTVEFKGLRAGEYTIEEVVAPNGYSTQFLPTFDVTIAKDGTVTFSKDTLGLVAPGDNTATVKNVKSITQLPLTGAAGIAMFVVLGALLAGAAATVFAKSRSTKRALNA
ncbi:SpaA isopeptide-forming pilin-related protein [Bifidobacterium saguinibicoloris]|uniref:SpaA isopeptide-forming pilin-related protein n=1 Tax=Bifidobacterium saguinibicoloris TaxID=2834433 RepID=UPI001C585DF7|nr:SpaA isopeptide-forming pilin-related protein [Bifidobacterium saguinibicoloris]MBW3081237.1 isopeptide-forming domain-containing fimbrial protein [Bifidobacterium saguinibicoloris]